ncbi:hypothetical protein [Mycetocola reblochoni]|uniref:Helix-turn-helix domain-containing protein n=1 Tax=Mycetocola reblochoni REB411 TaxID=1255698 RepID=A0A1R4INJ5_9MICO|nr:hypothetical protein [Mycetocola reblochoni]SJN20823.1 hypothetical protein FM119_02460 [Mycetocola reblochoni REB411]
MNWVTMNKAAELAGRDKRTIRRWVSAGKVRRLGTYTDTLVYLPDIQQVKTTQSKMS